MEINYFVDTLRRIGSTTREQLSWLVGLLEGPALGIEEWGNLHNALKVFAMHAASGSVAGLSCRDIDIKELPHVIVANSKSLREALKKARWGIMHDVVDVLERVAKRERFSLQQQPQAGIWDSERRRYLSVVAPEDDTFRKAVLRSVERCVFEQGHLLKECQASAKVKPGRKRKGEPKPEVGICGKLFVARKQTQLYCSGACLSRTLTRKKRAGKRAKKLSKKRMKRKGK